ncbi:hypothetical protein PVAND_008229 [Polypedilum vanderplanki]|uniref:Ras-related protein Rab n=1 Tax=Polypedilum vanderplanki TaxID=319348 RepID=A0A9J6CAC6_POLVA|nr:hypothetical protein PVAND_008229 [Polypedilum vanderplanki]
MNKEDREIKKSSLKSDVEERQMENQVISLTEELVSTIENSTNVDLKKDTNKKKKFKPKKFISKLNFKTKKNEKMMKNNDFESKTEMMMVEKVSSPILESFRRTFVKRFSRKKNYKVSPMMNVENNFSESMNNEIEFREISQVSKSDPNLCNSIENNIHKKINENSFELSKSMQAVDKKSVYAAYETPSLSSSFMKENKKVQLQITISGKKVEKVNTASANEITTTKTIVSSSSELDKASPTFQENRTDIMLPSTSTTVRVSTSNIDELFNVMVPKNNDNNANTHVLHQTKSISKPSVPYSTVVKEGLINTTFSVSEREIEKYLVLTSNLNSIISAAKDLDNLNSNLQKEIDSSKNLPKYNFEKEKGQLQLVESKNTMKKSKIPVNKQRRSSLNDNTTVHTQEAPRKPYNLNLSLSVSTEDLKEKEENDREETPKFKTPSASETHLENIKFKLGTPVRPPKILQPTSPIADIIITEAELLPSVNENESNDENFHTPKSESSLTNIKQESKARRKIAYIPELSIYTAEEQELLKSNITANHSESFDIPSLPQDSSIFPIFNECSVGSMTSSTPEKRECLYKILVIGELGTGKTSFIKRYVHQFFSQNYRATIGVDFALKVLSWDESTIIRLQLWDIAGQERYGNMTRVYYKEAVGAFIVFDVTRTPTFDAVNKWKKDLDSKVQLPDGSPIPCILLANKCDQQKQGLVTMPQKMDEYCRQNGFAGWFETSAKDNTNIEESAKALVSKILLNDKLIHNDMLDGDRLVLDTEDVDKPKKFCSC